MTNQPKVIPVVTAPSASPQTNSSVRLTRTARPVSFFAVPDSGEVRVRISENGKPKPVFPNALAVPDTVRTELALSTQELWYPRPISGDVPDTPWIINHCADADEYRQGLIWLDEAFAENVPIFNHPRSVARSRRDHSAKALQGISGLHVPRCIRFLAQSRASFERCFAENGFSFPVLVRPNSSQSGRGLVKIEGPNDWDGAVYTQWFGQPHFMSEFVDFATEDHLYLKARVVFVADKFFVRHVKGATSWKVHNESTNSLENFRDRETDLIDELNKSAEFSRICAAVPSRTRLDFCGMDIGVDPARNRFVMFECNASMSVFFKSDGAVDARRQARRDQLQTPVATAFRSHLRSPQAWVWSKTAVSQDGDRVTCRDLLAV